MSVSFMWEVVKPSKAQSFPAGTSSDISTLAETFGNEVSSDQIKTLRAMHRATGHQVSLWGYIAETLERLQGDSHDPVSIRVWTEF